MLIAIEGPDGSGKSTLISRLRESLKGNVLYISRSGRFTTELELIIFQGILNATYEQNLFQHIILDRHPWISEYVYGKVLREGGLLKDFTDDSIKKSLPNVQLIYCDAGLEAIRKTARREIQMEGVLQNLGKLHQRYSDLMEILKPRFSYDFEVVPEYSELDKIVEALNND